MYFQEYCCLRCYVFFISWGLFEIYVQLLLEEICQVVLECQFSFEDGVGFEQVWSFKEYMVLEIMMWQILWNIFFFEDLNYNILLLSMYCFYIDFFDGD